MTVIKDDLIFASDEDDYCIHKTFGMTRMYAPTDVCGLCSEQLRRERREDLMMHCVTDLAAAIRELRTYLG